MIQNHFTTHAWKKGEVRWTFSILPESNVRDMIGEYQRHLDRRAVFAPIPRKWLHMTILQLDSVEKISNVEASRIADRLRRPCMEMRMPLLSAGGWMNWGSPVIQVTPEPPLRELFGQVLKATRAVIGSRAPRHGDAFMPHMSIAYSRDYYKMHLLDDKFGRLDVRHVKFRARKLSLVRQVQTPPYYQWREYDEIELGQAD